MVDGSTWKFSRSGNSMYTSLYSQFSMVVSAQNPLSSKYVYSTGVGCHCLLQCMKVKSESEVTRSCPTLATPWTAAYQALPFMGFSRQEYWSGMPLPSLPTPSYKITKHLSIFSLFARSALFSETAQKFCLQGFVIP